MAEPDLTRADVYSALAQKAGFEVVTEKETKGQLRITGRCHPSRWPFFQLVIYQLDTLAEKAGCTWTCDISKKYFVRNGRLLYSWRFIFQSADMTQAYRAIVSVIKSAPLPARVEVDEVLLPGYKMGDKRGGVNDKGKGSSSAGSLPMAVTRKR